MCARIDVPVRVTESSRTRASPSRMMLMPIPALAIWRMMATVPTFRRSSGPGSSLSLSCSTSRISRSAPSARLTVSIDTPRVTASGCSVSGNATVLRRGRTESSVGSGGWVGSAILAKTLSVSAVRCRLRAWMSGNSLPRNPRSGRRASSARSVGAPMITPFDGCAGRRRLNSQLARTRATRRCSRR